MPPKKRANNASAARQAAAAVDADLLTLADEPDDRAPVVWGYARVSTRDQDVAAQVDALLAAGAHPDRIVTETASGTRDSRPRLAALMRLVRPGDVVTVWKLDRLGRSVIHLVRTIDELGKRGAHFRSVTDGIDTTTAQGRLLFGLLASIAQFEADLIRERTMLGLDRARAEGKVLGRPTRVKPEQYALIQRMRAEGETHEVIARSTGLSKSTVGRVLRDEIPELIARFGDRTGDEADLFESPLTPPS